MLELHHALAQEQPLITQVLQEHTAEIPDIVQPMVEHVLFAGGKRLRPFLCLFMGRLCGCTDKSLYTLGSAVEMLHTASLLHDDVIDNAVLRRSKAAAHTVFGVTESVLAGDALLAKALHIVTQFDDPYLTRCISKAVMQTAVGEIEEIASLRNTNLSWDKYISIITNKTAWMLRCSCEIGALRAKADAKTVEAAVQFGLALGIAFQIVDDVLDFSPATQTGKPSGGDMREGKITPPLLYYLESLPEKERKILCKKYTENALSDQEIAKVCTIIYDEGHARAALALSNTYLEQALIALQQLPTGKESLVLRQLTEYIQSRSH